MVRTLDATTGGPDANSYATEEEANLYFEDDPNRCDRWANTPPERRRQSLFLAARCLDRLQLRGTARSAHQALHFPTFDTVDTTGEGYVPPAVRFAQIEWAYDLLTNPPQQRIDRAALRSQGVEGFTRPGISERLASGPALPLPPIPPDAYAFLRPWLRAGAPTRRG